MKMKKLLVAMTLVGMLSACNDEENTQAATQAPVAVKTVAAVVVEKPAVVVEAKTVEGVAPAVVEKPAVIVEVKKIEVVAPAAPKVVKAPSGSDLYATCAGCHGSNGEGGVGPKLQGQEESALIAMLKSYKAGEDKGPMSAMMIPNAQALSEADINAVSAYITSFK